MNDIVTRLRQTRANMIGTEDEQHYWDCHDAADAIERLRLTDAEREAVWWCVSRPQTHWQHGIYAATLRGLLERMK